MCTQSGLVLYQPSIRKPLSLERPYGKDCLRTLGYFRPWDQRPMISTFVILHLFLHCHHGIAFVLLFHHLLEGVGLILLLVGCNNHVVDVMKGDIKLGIHTLNCLNRPCEEGTGLRR